VLLAVFDALFCAFLRKARKTANLAKKNELFQDFFSTSYIVYTSTMTNALTSSQMSAQQVRVQSAEPSSAFTFPRIMGVVNVTPDSFSDGGKWFERPRAVEHALQLIADGADILDVGGESSRPGAEAVPMIEELQRVIPVIEGVRAVHPTIPISIDTTKYAVAKSALEAGATMLNDITGLTAEPRLAELAAQFGAELVIMHIQGTPRTMQVQPTYTNVVREVFAFLERQIAFARSCGATKLYADVGIGFGKTVEHNFELLRHHAEFAALGVPMLLGISRKSFLGKILGIDVAAERDSATLALHLLLLKGFDAGVSIVRVHNVAQIAQARTLWQALWGVR
jgi:dihydropteroate synthase